jgi:hypothetical protein
MVISAEMPGSLENAHKPALCQNTASNRVAKLKEGFGFSRGPRLLCPPLYDRSEARLRLTNEGPDFGALGELLASSPGDVSARGIS